MTVAVHKRRRLKSAIFEPLPRPSMSSLSYMVFNVFVLVCFGYLLIPLSTLEATSSMNDPIGSAIWSEKLHHNPWCEDYYPIMIRQFWFFINLDHARDKIGKIRYDNGFNEACNKM